MKLEPCHKCGGEPWRNYDRITVTSLYCCKGTSTGPCPLEKAAQ